MDLVLLQLTPQEWSALALSVRVAFWATVLAFLPGILIAWLLARKQFVGKTLFDSLVHLPLVLPPVVPGFLLLMAFGNEGWIGYWLREWFGVSLAFTWQGAVLAAATMAFPLFVRAVRLSMEAVDPRLEFAASSLGASPLRVFLHVTLPLSWPGVLTGALLCFSRSLGEFGATITFVGNIPDVTRTLPLAIYSATQMPGGETSALRLIVLSLILAFGALAVGNWLAQRSGARST